MRSGAGGSFVLTLHSAIHTHPSARRQEAQQIHIIGAIHRAGAASVLSEVQHTTRTAITVICQITCRMDTMVTIPQVRMTLGSLGPLRPMDIIPTALLLSHPTRQRVMDLRTVLEAHTVLCMDHQSTTITTRIPTILRGTTHRIPQTFVTHHQGIPIEGRLETTGIGLTISALSRHLWSHGPMRRSLPRWAMANQIPTTLVSGTDATRTETSPHRLRQCGEPPEPLLGLCLQS